VDLVDTDAPGYDFSGINLIFIAGGNTFTLMSSLRQVDFRYVINNCLNRGGVVVGASAGALVLGPSIMIANEVAPDSNEIGLTDLSIL